MDDYCDELRKRVLARRGIRSWQILGDAKQRDKLDHAITTLAGRVLTMNQITVFFWLLDCEKVWEKIWDDYNSTKSEEVELNAVRRMSRRARATIVKHAINAPELSYLG